MPKRRWIRTNSEDEMFRGDLENASKYRDHVKLFASSFLKPQYARVAADEALGKNDSFAESPPPPPVALWLNTGHGLLILEVSRSHSTTHHSR